MQRANKWYAAPYYVWMVLFIVVPLVLVLFFSFTDSSYHFTLDNFTKFLSKGSSGKYFYVEILLNSLWIALLSTAICLLIGYPVALILSSGRIKRSDALITMIMMPMWMNFLLRTYSWMTILGRNGLVDIVLGWFNLGPIEIINTQFAIILGTVYNFLPFMILPIYSVMKKMDASLIEAAADLGANPFKVFLKVQLPLSLPGVISGITMVFMPAASTFVISSLLGGNMIKMIGSTIEEQFKISDNYNFGSAISMILMVLILISMLVLNKYQKGDKGELMM